MSWRELRRVALADLDTVCERDPAILGRSEALLHPSVLAVWSHRIAHRVHRSGRRRTARAVSALARLLTGGIEIHPGATVGARFFVDHGAAVVIGETAEIGDDVTLFHQVTLGSVGWWHDAGGGARRHPRIGDRVVVGANASVLGPVTVGPDTVVGAQALVLKDVPAGSRVMAPAATVGPKDRPARERSLRPFATVPAPSTAVRPMPVW